MGGRGASYNKTLTNSQMDAIDYYVGGDGMFINQFLRNGEKLTEVDKRFIKDLDSVVDTPVKDTTLYRSVDAQAIFGSMSDLEYDNLRGAIVYGNKDKFSQSALNKVKASVGKTITEKGYMSTTRSADIAEDWGSFSGSDKPIVMKITTTKGVKGRDISNATKRAREAERSDPQKETLLARGQKYTVDKVYSKNYKIYVDVTLRK